MRQVSGYEVMGAVLKVMGRVERPMVLPLGIDDTCVSPGVVHSQVIMTNGIIRFGYPDVIGSAGDDLKTGNPPLTIGDICVIRCGNLHPVGVKKGEIQATVIEMGIEDNGNTPARSYFEGIPSR